MSLEKTSLGQPSLIFTLAIDAGTDLAQMIERVNAGLVTVIPLDLDGIMLSRDRARAS
jgi:hypothetical protein